MIKSYKLTELALVCGVTRDTIKRHPEKYIPLEIRTGETRRSSRGYGIRYVRASDVLFFIAHGDVRLDEKYKNQD